MTALFEAWWPLALAAIGFFLLERLPYFLGGARVRRADHAAPLPVAAGPWLQKKLTELEIADQIRTHTGDDALDDAYVPHHRAVVVKWQTYASKRASARALAARSLAWAKGDLERSGFFLLVLLARAAGPALLFGCGALLVGNTLFAIPLATTIAFGLLVGAAVAYAVLLFSEILASRDALGLLADDDELDEERLAGCRRVLGAPRERAFVHLAVIATSLACWGVITERIGDGVRGGEEELAGAVLMAATVAAALVAVRGLFYGFGLVSSALGDKSPGVVTLLSPVALFVLLALTWDLSPTRSWQWLVLLAFVPAMRWLELLARLLFAAVFLVVWAQLARIVSEASQAPEENLPAFDSDAGRSLRGGEDDPRLALALALRDQPHEERFFASLTKGLALPLALAFWGVAPVL